MRAGTNNDLPMGTSLSMLVGTSHLLITSKALGSKLLASSGTIEILTTTSNNIMKKSQVVIREDTYLSLARGITINRWIASASTVD
jgi:hypothetical protein